jgi:hypothetical protein
MEMEFVQQQLREANDVIRGFDKQIEDINLSHKDKLYQKEIC